MSMAELLQLKEKLGKRVYGNVLFGTESKEGEEGGEGTSSGSRRRPRSGHHSEADFKRANKNRPREMSAKRPVHEVRDVFSVKKTETSFRDPRFEASSGEFKPGIFNKNYAFLNEVKTKEKKTLKKTLKKTSDPEKKTELKFLVKRMENQERSSQQRTESQDMVKRLKKQRMEETGKPFINKSEIKKIELVEKFKKLQKSGKLEKYMEKKRKKNASKERKRLKI
jgi:ribosomal RNA-processing protein 36